MNSLSTAPSSLIVDLPHATVVRKITDFFQTCASPQNTKKGKKGSSCLPVPAKAAAGNGAAAAAVVRHTPPPRDMVGMGEGGVDTMVGDGAGLGVGMAEEVVGEMGEVVVVGE